MTELIFTRRAGRRAWILMAVAGVAGLIQISQLSAQDADLEISLGGSGDTTGIELRVSGGSGNFHTVEETEALDAVKWAPLSIRRLSDPNQSVSLEVPADSSRFFRTREFDPDSAENFVGGFRMTDHRGISHELHYEEDRAAVLLIFVDRQALESDDLVTRVKSVRDEFTANQVVTWLVNVEPGASRVEIAASAAATRLDVPILDDRTQVLGIGLDARAELDAVILDPESSRILFQGPLAAEENGANLVTSALREIVSEKTAPVRLVKSSARPLPIQSPTSLTYTHDIAEVLQKHCVQCHSDGNIAPFSMTEYESVADRSRQIRRVVLSQQMPPWHADPEYGHFVNDSALPAADAQRLITWIDEGGARGDGPDPLEEANHNTPVPVDYPATWPKALGEPDYVISIPKQDLPANGEVDYRYITVKTDLPKGEWLRAAVVLPSNKAVVHHALAFNGSFEQFLGGLDGYFSAYLPGTEALTFPEGTGKWLPKGEEIVLQIHYITTGQPESDTTSLGLYFHDEEPQRALITEAASSIRIYIPPNALDHEMTASKTFDTDVLLYELSPHMHYRGSRFRYEAHYPDGSVEILINIPKYWFDWQRPYRFAEPKRLPKGTAIVCVGAFDNSRFNHENPDPSKRVRFGEQTDDEMFIGYIHYSEE